MSKPTFAHPRSPDARARDRAILDQILDAYTEGGLRPEDRKTPFEKTRELLPEERRAVLKEAQDMRLELARAYPQQYDDEWADEAAAEAIFRAIKPLIGPYPGYKLAFKYNPLLADSRPTWRPGFYEPKDPETLPPRECFYDGHYYPRELVGTVAPGGRGKSLLSHAEAIAMITGKPLLGVSPSRPLRVLMMNFEDHQDELERRHEAARKHYRISKEDVRGRIIIASVQAEEMCFAKDEGDGVQIVDSAVESLRETIERNKIDVVIIDPWVSAHGVGHNDIHKVQPIVTMFKGLAEDTGACIELVIHPKKTQGEQPLDEEDILGSVGLPNKTRDVRVLNAMTKDEASKWGVAPWAMADYFRVDNPKHTHKRSARPVWRQKISVSLGNGSAPTEVGVVVPWSPPTAESVVGELTSEQVVAIKAEVAAGMDDADQRAGGWAGKAVAKVLDLDVDDDSDKAKVKLTLAALVKAGHFTVGERPSRTTKGRTSKCLNSGQRQHRADG